VDAGLCAIAGTLLFFWPSLIASVLFTGQSDGVHWHLLRCIGGQLVAFAYVLYRFSRSRTETLTCCLLLRIMSSILMILVILHARSQFAHLISTMMINVMLMSGFAAICVYIVMLLSSGWKLGTTLNVSNRIGNGLYQLDSLASLTIGSAWLSVPAWLLHKQVSVSLDPSHEMLGRLLGCFFASSYIVSAHALYWSSSSDRDLAIDARLMCCALILSAQCWSQFAYKEHWTGTHWVGISLFSIWTVVAVIYRLITCEMDRRRRRRKEQ